MKTGDKVRYEDHRGVVEFLEDEDLIAGVLWDDGHRTRVYARELTVLEWTRKMPQKVGHYWVRTSDGLEAGIVSVCSLHDGRLFTPRYATYGLSRQLLPGTSWGGWWWSEPVPECPPWP